MIFFDSKEVGREIHTTLVIGDVRGTGLMLATEIIKDGNPHKATASAVQQACLARNLLLQNCGTYGNVIRWIPPLVVTKEQIEEAIEIFAQAFDEVMSE